jgi:hypothetical protein
MNGITLNIVAYAILSIVMYYVNVNLEDANHRAVGKHANIISRIKLSAGLLLSAWSMFMFLYLIIDYKNIMVQPLNVRLNFFESITNILTPLFIGAFVLTDKIVWRFSR